MIFKIVLMSCALAVGGCNNSSIPKPALESPVYLRNCASPITADVIANVGGIGASSTDDFSTKRALYLADEYLFGNFLEANVASGPDEDWTYARLMGVAAPLAYIALCRGDIIKAENGLALFKNANVDEFSGTELAFWVLTELELALEIAFRKGSVSGVQSVIARIESDPLLKGFPISQINGREALLLKGRLYSAAMMQNANAYSDALVTMGKLAIEDMQTVDFDVLRIPWFMSTHTKPINRMGLMARQNVTLTIMAEYAKIDAGEYDGFMDRDAAPSLTQPGGKIAAKTQFFRLSSFFDAKFKVEDNPIAWAQYKILKADIYARQTKDSFQYRKNKSKVSYRLRNDGCSGLAALDAAQRAVPFLALDFDDAVLDAVCQGERPSGY